MRPLFRIGARGLAIVAVLSVAVSAAPAFAQFLDPTLQQLGLTSDVPRSPRLVGMGSLSLVIPDHYQHLDLWQFAQVPAAAATAESSSTLDLRPGSESASSAYDMIPGLVRPTGGFREDLAGRAAGMPFEVFHRDPSGNSYGAVGTFTSVHDDIPFSDDVETRTSVSHPSITPIIAGSLPWFDQGRLRYGIHMQFGRETVTREYRGIVHNDGGDFITLDGETELPPDLFEPLNYDVRTIGIGASLMRPIGKFAQMAIGITERGDRIDGSDERDRTSSEINESRPTDIGQAAITGHIGKSFEFGIDGHAWRAKSQQNWVFTTSSGSGVPPLSGRGKLLERDERGTSLNNRVLWNVGRLALAGQAWTNWTRVVITPPDLSDLSSLNHFLTLVYQRQGADSLALPDSIVANHQEDHAYGVGGGASMRMKRGIAGVEYHWSRDEFDQTFGGFGPRRVGWDVRGGLEYSCSPVVTGRIGAGYGRWDENTFLAGDEWTQRSGSIGLGLHPRSASWTLDIGYSLAWLQSDFADPMDHRGSRQHLESLVHWGF
jgi:hypothetical protein